MSCVLCSLKALLGAIGVGEKSATVIGATFQWFLRDLTGMLGGILFTFYQVPYSCSFNHAFHSLHCSLLHPNMSFWPWMLLKELVWGVLG
ncbi:putative Root UVB sensitive family [Rosa chinensis]|uniref:Putative Root UVB sensitive family n=1 Tax=Rosa chinensis TaxID=74649 RepID=A0A2P6R2K2_ROSCH|nr:putative Root UVB sensitive family [Rosa chinensis]